LRTLKERRLTCACAFIRHALDPEDDSSSGTLRAAVSASNGNGEADTITFDLPEGNRTTTLTSGQIDFSASEQTTIDGGAAGVTVNGGASRVLQVVSGARLDLKNLTVANGGGIYGGGIHNNPGGTATLRNTIVANSPGGNCSGSSITDEGGNLDDGSSCRFSGTSQSNAQDGLAPDGLQDNGGTTKTIALLPESDAIDAGVEANCPQTDQRGVGRPQGAGCDIGAFELEKQNAAPKITVVAGSGSQSACLSNSSGRITLELSDANDDPLTLSATSSNTRLVPNSNVSFGGSGDTRTAAISTVSGRTGSSTVTITASDGQSSTTTTVTVKAGGNGRDTLTGTSGADLLFGQNGDDTLSGLGEDDVLCGANGNDQPGGGSDSFD